MIRINLLPQAKRATASAATGTQIWGYLYLASAVVWCIALAFVYFSLVSDRDQALAQNAEVERQVQRVKQQGGNLEELQKQLEKSRQIEQVVNDLLAARQGPTRMLLELAGILSQGRGPTVDAAKLEELRRANPEAGFSPGWDVRRLWIKSFKEDQLACTIQGEARNNEDIAEFLRRLSLSAAFDDVTLVRTGQAALATATATAPVNFELKCKVRY
jgi:type IV pilus assembly protein PilN